MVDLLGPDEWIEDWAREILLPGAVVGLDIPIEGCAVNDEAFRPVERALIKVGIPLLPSAQAGSFGSEIAARIKEAVPDCRVVEVYPYAILRVLWSLLQAGEERPLQHLLRDEVVHLLDSRHWKSRPPRYKRARGRERLAHALRRASGVLESSPYGRALDDLYDDPFVLLRRTDLDRVTDAFDALLGLVAVDLLCRTSPYAKVFSVPGHAGEVVGLADAWLWGRWLRAAREVALS